MSTPRTETRDLVIERLRAKLRPVEAEPLPEIEQLEHMDGGPTEERAHEPYRLWEGVDVVTRADIEAVYWEPLPPFAGHRSELLAPGRVTTTLVCPNCAQSVTLELLITTTLEWGAKGRKLKPKVEGSAVAHVCGQVALPEGHVEGQVEAFPGDDEAVEADVAQPNTGGLT